MKSECDIIQVDRLECRITQHNWAFEKERAQDILRHWRLSSERNPSLYDGRILLAQRIEADLSDAERILRVDFFETSFSAFIAWRDFGWPDKLSLIVFLRRLFVRVRAPFYWVRWL